MSVWLFDVDGCLVDAMSGTSLRPGSRPLLEHLRDDGIAIHVWSAGGAEYAERVLGRVGIADLAIGYHDKVRADGGRWLLPGGFDPRTLVCVDDQPDGVPDGPTVVPVFPYIGSRPHDPAFGRLLASVIAGDPLVAPS